MNTVSALSLGGTINPEADTTHLVSYYHIPGGSNYEMAYPVNVYFSSEESAQKFSAVCKSEQMAQVLPYKV